MDKSLVDVGYWRHMTAMSQSEENNHIELENEWSIVAMSTKLGQSTIGIMRI